MESQNIWETFFGLVNFVYFPLYVQPRFMPELEFQHFGLRVHPTVPVHPRPLLVPCAPQGPCLARAVASCPSPHCLELSRQPGNDARQPQLAFIGHPVNTDTVPFGVST